MILKPSSCEGCPLYEAPYGKKTGFSHPDGSGANGVMVVAEALGEHEEKEGIALVGKAGYALFQALARVGISREGFTLFNVCACRPPDNKLAKMPYEQAAIDHCRPNLDAAIDRAQAVAQEHGKTFVILTLGQIAFKRILDLDSKSEILKNDYLAYPFWSDRYRAWVLAADHPAYLLRGKANLWPVLQFTFKRALEIADKGLQIERHDYLLDPDPAGFERWVKDYLDALHRDPETLLSYDIETPYKKKKGEEELGQEEFADHTILRCSFAYRPGSAVSVRWSAEYMAGIEELFGAGGQLLGHNSDLYDKPRVSRHVRMAGPSIDAMVAWHILNTSLPKSLGFITPFYVQNTEMWKHLSDSQPAFYNAKDADMALRNYIGIKKDLVSNKLWNVFDRHVLVLNKALNYMTGEGVWRDNEMRDRAEATMTVMLNELEEKMQNAVPEQAREFKILKKAPKDLTGWSELSQEIPVPVCLSCGLLMPKRWKKHATLCNGTVGVCGQPGTVWSRPKDFKLSVKGLTNYQKALRHQAIIDRKEKRVTFNEDAIVKLMKTYPNDPLYPLILDYRKISKLLGTYIGVTEDGKLVGGMPVGQDGKIHTTYSHNPSTLRLASQDPNMQNLPRPSNNPDDLVNIIRNLVVASPGGTLYARDYSGIEAVLSFYFAMDPRGIRLAKRDIHTYYTVYALHELDGRVKAADLPDINWPDDRLFPYLEQLKKEFKHERNTLYKHLVHAANFMQSPKGAQEKIFSETRIEYPIKTVAKVMDVYFALFPTIRRWHTATLEEADKEGYLRNPFGYVHRFSKVFDYKKEFGAWSKKPNPDVANKVVAFKPQSTAAAIIKESIIRMYYNRFEEAGKYLRLQVHDENLLDVPSERLADVDRVVLEEMERPIPELPCPASWNMGPYLSINTESKSGPRWGTMK